MVMHKRMNWQNISFDWNQARAFLATAEEGSLSAAARVLGQTQPTLGRQVNALEEELGILLFDRIGRSLYLTPAGEDLLVHVRTMRDAASRLSIAASSQSQAIEGEVKVSVSDVLASYMISDVLKRIRDLAPRLQVHLVATDEISDLQRREADIAIRHVRPVQPDLIARLVREDSADFYASQDYLKKRGFPKSKPDLKSHDFIGFGNNERMIEYMKPLGIQLDLTNFKFGCDSGAVGCQLASEGLGIIPISRDVAARIPNLLRVLPDMDPIRFPIWLTTHRELHTSSRIRLVFDVLAEYFSGK